MKVTMKHGERNSGLRGTVWQISKLCKYNCFIVRAKEDWIFPFNIYISLKFTYSNKSFPSYAEIWIFLNFMLTTESMGLMLWSTALAVFERHTQVSSFKVDCFVQAWAFFVFGPSHLFPNSVLLHGLGNIFIVTLHSGLDFFFLSVVHVLLFTYFSVHDSFHFTKL